MADIIFDVLPEIQTVSALEPGIGLVDQQLIVGDPAARARALQNLALAFTRTNTHMMGYGLGSLQKGLGAPVNLAHLEAQFDRMDQIGLPKTLTIYNVPGHYKVLVQPDGTRRALAQPEEHFSDKGRPSPALFDELMDLIRRPIELALRRGVRNLYIWNEAKGFYAGPTPQSWALDDFLQLYNGVVDVILGMAQGLGIASSAIKIGGPYVPIRLQSVRNASSLPPGHPLNGAWGGVRKEAIHFLEGFVRQVKRLDALVIDVGLGLVEGKPLLDEFANCGRIGAIVNYARELAQSAGWNIPVEFAEYYLVPQDESQHDPALRAALAAEALRRMVEVGVGAAYAWGFRYGDESAILTATDNAGGGAPLPVWEVMRAFKEHFSRGQPVHRLNIRGEGVSALANDEVILLINQTNAPRTVGVGSATHSLAAYEWRIVPWTA